MMMIRMKEMMAMSLVLMAVTGFTGCNMGRPPETGMAPEEEGVMTPEEQMAEAERQRLGEDGMAEGERTVSEPVSNIENLQSGQPLSYYNQQLERMGYTIHDMDRSDDQVIYRVGKDRNIYQVTLTQPMDTRQVRDVDVKQLREWTVTSQRQDPQAQRVLQQVEQMAPGKKPVEYLPQLGNIGTVTDYKLDDDKATVHLETNNKRYKILMDVDASRNTVTDVKLEQPVWDIPV